MATVATKKAVIKKIKTAKIVKKTIKPKSKKKIPAWEVMLGVINPKNKRPRRTSLHTIATVIGAKDPLKLAKEMKASKKVVGYVCPDVKTPIFYLKSMIDHPGMIDTRDSRVWGKWRYPDAGAISLADFVKKNPYPKVKGFKRFVDGGKWSGGEWGVGKYIAASSAMEVPYEKADYDYAKEVIKALKKAGHKPGITKAILK